MSFEYRKPISKLKSSDPFVDRIPDVDGSDQKAIGSAGVNSGSPLGYPGNSSNPLEEPPDDKQSREEQEKFEETLEQVKNTILSIDDKFRRIDEQNNKINDTFFIRFDPALYPDISLAVIFYTNGEHRNYISWSTYLKAKNEQIELYNRQKSELTASSQHTSSGISPGQSSIQSVKKRAKQKSVWQLAFQVLLPQLIKWFYSRPVIKSVMGFFNKSGESSKSKIDVQQMLEDVGIAADLRVIDGELINFEDLRSDEARTERSTALMDYVMDCIKGNEIYLEANIPFPEAILMDEWLLSMKEEFYIATELTHSFIDDSRVRAIGTNSAIFNPDSMPYARQSIILSKALRPILQDDFLNKLDGNLSRILRILQGWYMDPRTYCCLINIMGGISKVVPRWLYAIRFNLKASIILLDLEHLTISDSLKNILNMIVQGIIGSIVMHLHAYVRGWLSKKEHELLASILDSSSKLARCLPYEMLVQEFKIQADYLVNRLYALVNSLSGRLMVSVDRFDDGISIMERRLALRQVVDLLDIFINTWEVGYVCGQASFSEELGRPEEEERRPIIGSLDDVPEQQRYELNIKNGAFRPPLSKEEMVTFLKDHIKLNEDTISSIANIYDNPQEIESCMAGFSSNQISIYKTEVSRITANN